MLYDLRRLSTPARLFVVTGRRGGLSEHWSICALQRPYIGARGSDMPAISRRAA